MPSKKNNCTDSKNDQCKIFYQYQTIGVEKFPLTNIEKNQLCFRCPTEFNDPFDCLGDIVYSGVKDEFSRFLPPLEKYKLKDDNYLVDPFLFSQNKPNSEPTDLRKRLRVCCFSESDRNILLWSHYADYHRGICFGFEGQYLDSYGKKAGLTHNRKHYSLELETKGLLKPFLHKVIYQPAFPKQINMVASKTPIAIIDFLLTKGSEWKYEKEYRLFDLDFDNVPYKLYKFKKEALKKVIFGISTPDPIIKETINIVQREYLQKGYSVELYKMMVLDKKYAVVPRKIECKV